MGKVILIDTSGIFFPCVFSHERQLLFNIQNNTNIFILPSHTVYFNSILSSLKKIGVDEDTIVIMSLEGKSWRKSLLSSYKAQREADRAKHDLINWDKEFDNLNRLHETLDKATNWHFVRQWESESDDIISVACRFYKDKEVIVVTGDHDLHQLAYYSNVKIFNINKKVNGSKGMFELIKNPLKIIADKARKGDVSDNLIVTPEDTDEDFQLRHQLVNLLELPAYIEQPIIEILYNLPKKELHLDLLPNFKDCKEKFLRIYDEQYKITPEYCYSLIEKRKERKKKEAKLKKEK